MSEDTHLWADRAREAVKNLFYTTDGSNITVTGQQLREKIVPVVGEPPTPYVFGPFISRMVKEGWLLPTGEKVKMTGKQAHGRMTPVYQL